MKVVWILNHYAETPNGTSGARHFYLAKHLARSGWKTILIASSVEHPSGKQRLSLGESTRFQTVQGVDYLWLRGPSYSGNGRDRILGMLSYSLSVLKPKIRKELPKPDLILGSSVHPFSALSAWALSIIYRVPFVFEVRDLWPQTLVDMGHLTSKSMLARFFYALEKFLYQRARKIVVLMPGAAGYISNLGIPKDKIEWISNGSDVKSFPAFPEPNNEPFTFMYFGAHGQANSLITIIEALRIIKERYNDGPPPLRVRLIGDGPLKESLIDVAKETGLSSEWLSFESSVAKSSLPFVAAESDAFILALLDLPELYRFGISMNKIFDYMAGARPILIASNAANDPVREAECGFSVPAEKPDLLAKAMLELAQLPLDARKDLGQRALRHVSERYSYQSLADKLAVLLDECFFRRT